MKFIIPIVLIFTSSFAHSLSKAHENFLKDNNIRLMSEEITDEHIDQFKVSYLKLPGDLNQELLDRGRIIHLIFGIGVSDDPTWGNLSETFDGRGWDIVPGAGGSPYWKRPTRIVVNKLHEGHGSKDLVLHEEAHTIDCTYGDYKISSNVEFGALFDDPTVQAYLSKICSTYCEENKKEAFAELFAHYYTSNETREALEFHAPSVAEFFRNFRSIKQASKKGHRASDI